MTTPHDRPMATDLRDAPRPYEGPVSIEYTSPDTAVFRDGKGRRIDDGFVLDAVRQAVKPVDHSHTLIGIGLGAAVLGAVLTTTMLYFTRPEHLPSEIVAQRSIASLERELLGCVRTLDTTTKSVDFWRNAALAMRTDGVDSLRPIPEGKP